MREPLVGPVFTRADARALGWPDAAISRATRSGRIIRVRKGHFSLRPADDLTRAIAAARACGGSAISHRSALAAYGLPIVGHRPPTPELAVPPHRIGGLRDAHLHRASLHRDDVALVNGEPTTSLARTLVDVGRSRPPWPRWMPRCTANWLPSPNSTR